jgi:hypothetical protein
MGETKHHDAEEVFEDAKRFSLPSAYFSRINMVTLSGKCIIQKKGVVYTRIE